MNRWFDVESDAEDKIDEAVSALLVSRLKDIVAGPVPVINSEDPVENAQVRIGYSF